MALLDVEDLQTQFHSPRGLVKAVDRVSLWMNEEEVLGLAGESGCGKTTLALSIAKLLPAAGRIVGGKILFKGSDLVPKKEDEMRKIRWKEISIVFQGAMNALNPVYKIGEQIAEAILFHESINPTEAKSRVDELLNLVGIEPQRANGYPHEFSGGMKQRCMIAMALACNPDLVLADEPTTALDVITQSQIMKLIKTLQKDLKLSMILISHDLSVIAQMATKVAIMYAGKIIEFGDPISIFKTPTHPYAKALVAAFPNLKGSDKELVFIPGSPPNLVNPPSGCRFHPRCNFCKDPCSSSEPTLQELEKGHYVACHLVK